MAASSSSGRIPQGEVIMDFADGGQYIKHKLENAVLEVERRKITKEEGIKAQKAMEALDVKPNGSASAGAAGGSVKAEDVDLIVSQVGCTKEDATAALKAEKGDLVKALIRSVQPRPRARSVDGGAEVKK
ncbi:uncharacterized protein I303_106143 [Kwoniella dejecticola CBS 10117]|uniref:Nascent polypeptide-associated complex subunit alpha-like UBA domain-containing protein n=1 Tax=Kwoniella dejecticola CBS 10117 TaxID=1296121 RepID=A0A1A6A1E4_9TREE|nr:uncharacterized protein I303_06161 [Kwoniella dejecticola CBS 10117]OBR83878.1 hypothetical protein I303_06161 [Kwoniella dejecticola CBS 10117]